MNKTFRSVWNASKQAYVAAAETVSARGKPCSSTKVATAVASLLGGLLSMGANAQTAPPATALPAGGQVSAGQANISQSGANMVIQQGSDRAAINWQTFNVGKDAQVQFQQPGASSVTLNRVMSSDPSQIFGRITANGQVILTNPQGVYFGKDARVDVGGIIATTHGISDADFMAGKNRFERNGSTGSVVNEGEIKTSLGGYIALLAPEVRNQGAIIAHMGSVALAAGEAIDLKFDSNNRLTSIRVEPSQIQALVDNRHAVQAPGGLIILSAQSMDRLLGGVVKNSGRIEANGLQQQGGRIILSASHKVENTGGISANATTGNTAGAAGKIDISAPEVVNTGSISATGSTQHSAGNVLVQATQFTQTATGRIDLSAPVQGGTLTVHSTGKTQLQGQVDVSATQEGVSQGGQIDIVAQGNVEVTDATLNASGGQGGQIKLRAAAPAQTDNPNPLPAPPNEPGQGRLAIVGNSTLSTRGRSGKGGSSTLLGDHVDLLDSTAIDATGTTGGGTVLVGGDWQGSNGVYQATTVTMTEGVSIDASATENGNGGKVVLWSDVSSHNSVTTVSGSLYAKGGANGGDGGQIETSGHLLITEGVHGSAAAPHGSAGEWLFDPTNVTIGDGATAASAQNDGSNISASSISSLLSGGTSVTVTTFSAGSDLGDLTVTSAISKSSGDSDVALTLRSANSIVINQAILHTGGVGKLNLVLDADNNTAASTAGTTPVRDGGGITILEANLSTGGGTVTFGGTAAGTGGIFSGGDLFVGGTNAVTITTIGGVVDVKGNLIIANSSTEGFTISTSGGAIDLRRAVDSGNSYQSITGQRTWEQARADAISQGGWLATIGSSLENALAIRAANYQGAWLGGERIIGTNEWRWTQDPAYNASSNPMVFFYQGATTPTTLGSSSSGFGGTTATGYYANWAGWINGTTGVSEPNNWNGSGAGAFSQDNESVLQFIGALANWNDLSRNTSSGSIQQYVLEKNLVPSRLNLNAGAGAVTIGGGVGFSKALSQLNVTSSNTSVAGSGVVTTGAQTYSSGLSVSNEGPIKVSGTTVTFNGNFSATATGAAGATHDVVLDAAFVNNASSPASFNVESVRHIQLGTNASITSNNAALNTTLWADTDRSGDGINFIEGSGITTHGGSLTFGKAGETATIGSNTVLVGGDVFFQRGSAQSLNTAGGAINIYGETIVANTAGLTFNSGNGSVTLHGLLNSGNSYAFVATSDNYKWTDARTAAKGSTAGAGGIGDTYLVNITSRLENSIAGLTAGYRSAWIGAYRDRTNALGGGDTRWYWADGPQAGTYFYTQSNRTTVPGYYSNFGTNEPNGTGTTGEAFGQFYGSAGGWNDLGDNGGNGDYTVKGYVRETNLAASPVTINAGTGVVTFSGPVGTSKALSTLTVNGGVANINGGAVSTQGTQTYNAPVVLGAHTTLTTSQSDIVFNSTVNSAPGTNWNLTTNIVPATDYYWVDWISATATSVTGRIVIGGETINVTYTNNNGFAFVQTDSGAPQSWTGYGGSTTNYWTGYLGAGFSGTSPYVSAQVANGPTGYDMIALRYAGSQTLTFDKPVENLAFSVMSMNGNGYAFNQNFDIVSYTGFNGAGQGYFGGGTMTKAVVGNTFQLNDGGLNATSQGVNSEPHGTIRFNKAFDTLTWQSQSNEFWNAFTVGVTGSSANAGAVRFNAAVGGGQALGNMAVNAQLVTSANAMVNAGSLAVTGLAELGNNITTTGNQSFGSAVTLNNDVTLQTTANGSISTGETATINGSRALGIQTSGTGTVSLGGRVGNTTALTSLSVQTNTGGITIGGATTVNGLITMQGGALTLDAGLTSTATGCGISLTGKRITQSAGVAVTTQGGDITYTVTDSPWTSGDDRAIYLAGTSAGATTSLNANGGNISLSASYAITGESGGFDRAVELDFATVKTSGTGTISIAGDASGNGNASGTNAWGIGFNTVTPGSSVLIQSENGAIALTGTAGKASDNSRGMASDGNALKILSASGAITLNDIRPSETTGTYLGLYLKGAASSPIYIGADGTSLLTGSSTASTSNVTINADAVSFLATGSNGVQVNTTGTVAVQPYGTSFSSALNWPLTNLTLASSVSGLTIGKSTNTAAITIGSATTVAGPINIYGSSITINAVLTAVNSDINLHASGAVTQTAALTASGLGLHGAGTFTLTNTNNTISTLAGGSSSARLGSLNFVNAGALEVGSVNPSGIWAQGDVKVETLSGDLTLSLNINTLSTAATAVVLNAGKNAAAGTDTGGDIKLDGSVSITTGTGGRATLYTGSLSSSAGVVTSTANATDGLIAYGSGHFRYNSDETTTNYNQALGTGLYAIYREQPSVGVTVDNKSMTYGDSVPTLTGTVSGRLNGDSAQYAVSNRLNATSGNIKAGSYSLTETNLTTLGYNVTLTDGSLTVSKKNLTVTGTTVADKVYDGKNTAALSGGALVGVVGSDSVTLQQAGTFADKNVGTGKVVTAANTIDSDDAGNYTLTQPTNLSANISRLDSVTWTGGSSGNWFDPSNWANDAVPDLSNVATVVIPKGNTVNFNTTGNGLAVANQPVFITGLQGNGATLNFSAGTLNVGNGGATFAGFDQSAGTVISTGIFSVSSAFSQTGGALTTTGSGAHVNIAVASGDLTWTNIASGGDLTVNSTGKTIFGITTVGGNLTSITRGANIGGGVTQHEDGKIEVAGTAEFIADTGADQDANLTNSNNDFQGTVSFTQTNHGNWRHVSLKDKNSLTLGMVNTTGNLTVDATGALDLGTSTVGGGLNANSHGGNITQTGALTVTGDTTFNAGAGNITLDNAGNDFLGTVNATGNNVNLTDANGLTVVLNASGNSTLTAGGNLAVSGNTQDLNTTTTNGGSTSFGATTVRGNLNTTSSGDVNQTGAFNVAGTSDFNAPGKNVNLNNASNNFGGAFSATGDDITVVDGSGGLTLGNIDASGKLDATSTGGKITQANGTTIAVEGETTLNAGSHDITLDNAGNDFVGTVNATGNNVSLTDANGLTAVLNASGNSTLTAGGNLAVSGNTQDLNTTTTNGGSTSFGATTVRGNLNTTSSGDVNQTGALNVAGTSDFNAPGKNVNLNNASNDFAGTVNATGNNVSLTDGNSLTLGTVTTTADLSLENNGPLNLGTSTVGGNFKAKSNNGNISQSGALRVAGNSKIDAATGAVNLTDPGNNLPQGVDVTASSYSVTGDGRRTAAAAAEKVQGSLPTSIQLGTGTFSASAPQPLVMTSSSVMATSSASSTSSGQTSASTANSSGITVDLRDAPVTSAPTLAAVSLPKGTATAGIGFSFELPESIRALANSAVNQASLPDGTALPTWLRFDPQNLRFEAGAVPNGAFPMQLLVTVGGRQVLVVISERTE